MKRTAMIFGTALALAIGGQAQAAVDARAPIGEPRVGAVLASPQTAGFWGFCGPGRYYRHAEFVEVYSGGILIGAIYTTAGCHTPA